MIRRCLACTSALPFVPALASAMLLASVFGGCDTIERAEDRQTPIRARPGFKIEVSKIMRGTIAQESIMLGYQPVIVRGYGLVVGLDGTGSATMPPDVRAHMLTEISRHGVGDTSRGMGHITPQRLLDSLDTAVVIVEGVIPPGAVGRSTRRGMLLDGTPFDIRVRIDPRSEATSLEGGRLYTTELRPSETGQVFPRTGGSQASSLAKANGPIFVNPFADPGSEFVDSTVGRILNGGEVLEDIPIKLRLATPSHARAEIIQSAINTRFPREPGMADTVAHGESDASLRITVPTSFRHDPEEFVTLLRHTSLRTSRAAAIASTIRRTVLEDPAYADAAAWRWRALGPRALPIIRELYDEPAEVPRLAALRAGSNIGDALTIGPLIEMARNGSNTSARLQAIRLLERQQYDPRVETALIELLEDSDVDVRLAAYETMNARGAPEIERLDIDGKFRLDVVPSSYDMIYITQTGQPRIVLFGHNAALNSPAYADIWDGRLIVKDSPRDDEVEVFYRPSAGGAASVQLADRELAGFIEFLGHKLTVDRPAPGIGLTYGHTIGALYQLHRDGALDIEFKADQDRVTAALLRMRERPTAGPRPEFAEELEASDPDYEFLRTDLPGENPAGSGAVEERGRFVELPEPPALDPEKDGG